MSSFINSGSSGTFLAVRRPPKVSSVMLIRADIPVDEQLEHGEARSTEGPASHE